MNVCGGYTTERTRSNSGSSCSKTVNCSCAGAVIECSRPDTGDAVADGCARQAGAVIECLKPDAGDAVGNDDARQADAGRETVRPQGGHAVADGDARQGSAVTECATSNRSHITANVNRSEVAVKIITS